MQKDSKDKFETLAGQSRDNTEQVMIQVKDLKKHFKGAPGDRPSDNASPDRS